MGGFNFVLSIIIYKVLFFLWIIELGYLVDFIIMVLYVYNFCFVKEKKIGGFNLLFEYCYFFINKFLFKLGIIYWLKVSEIFLLDL